MICQMLISLKVNKRRMCHNTVNKFKDASESFYENIACYLPDQIVSVKLPTVSTLHWKDLKNLLLWQSSTGTF